MVISKKQKPLRILMLNYEFPPIGGGAAKQFMYLSKELARKNEVYVLTTGWKKFGIFTKENYTIHALRTSRKKTLRCSTLEMLDYIRKAWFILPKVINKFKPNKVIIFFTIPTGILAFHPSLKEIPYLISVRGSDVPGHNPNRFKLLYKILTPITKKIWDNADRVICNSENLKKEVLNIYPRLEIEVIPNGVDTAKFKPIKKSNKNLTLLYAGRLIPLKNIDLIIEQLPKIIKSTKKNVILRIIGSGEQEKYLKELTIRLGLKKNVVFVGEIDYSKIEKEYQKADIYVQLSSVEGMSNTILEAMACGLPIITTNVGGAQSVIKENGIIIEPNQLHNTIHNIKQIMGIKSRQIAQKYSFEKNSERYEAV